MRPLLRKKELEYHISTCSQWKKRLNGRADLFSAGVIGTWGTCVFNHAKIGESKARRYSWPQESSGLSEAVVEDAAVEKPVDDGSHSGLARRIN